MTADNEQAIVRDTIDNLADLMDLPIEGDEPVGELAVRCRDAFRRLQPQIEMQVMRRGWRRNEMIREAAERADASVAALAGWQLGRVVEDRWGLRWRADIGMARDLKAWSCRSAGIRTWRTSEEMLKRGPLTFVRVDKVFAGAAAKEAREAGERDDASVTVDPDAAEDGVVDQVATP